MHTGHRRRRIHRVEFRSGLDKDAACGIVNLDKLTYAGNLGNLASLQSDPRHTFVRGDICEPDLMLKLLQHHKPRAVVHFAAESHVDRSISDPGEFVRTNVNGTLNLLQQSRAYWDALDSRQRDQFRFLHVSTDEVYGTLSSDDPAFTENTPYAPNSPYAASKAGSDHLVRAYHHTYGFPTLTTNCSNNYGPFQFPEKLIPLVLLKALDGEPLPVYGDGLNVSVTGFTSVDHCEGIRTVLATGKPWARPTTSAAAMSETNIDVVTAICDILDELRPSAAIGRAPLADNLCEGPARPRSAVCDRLPTKIRR